MEANIKQLESRVAELEIKLGLIKGLEIERKAIWFAAWKTVAGAFNCKTSEVAAKWADDCLRDYDAKFNSRTGEAKGTE